MTAFVPWKVLLLSEIVKQEREGRHLSAWFPFLLSETAAVSRSNSLFWVQNWKTVDEFKTRPQSREGFTPKTPRFTLLQRTTNHTRRKSSYSANHKPSCDDILECSFVFIAMRKDEFAAKKSNLTTTRQSPRFHRTFASTEKRIMNEYTHRVCVCSSYLGLVALKLPVLPRHGGPAEGLPQHSHTLHLLLTSSSHSWMAQRRKQGGAHTCARTRTHKHVLKHPHT